MSQFKSIHEVITDALSSKGDDNLNLLANIKAMADQLSIKTSHSYVDNTLVILRRDEPHQHLRYVTGYFSELRKGEKRPIIKTGFVKGDLVETASTATNERYDMLMDAQEHPELYGIKEVNYAWLDAASDVLMEFFDDGIEYRP